MQHGCARQMRDMTEQNTQGASKTTAAAAEFVQNITYDALPAEALRIGTRCLIDGLGLFVGKDLD
ncbi:MAG TPA: hypothetical protein VHK27_13430 [Gammaproteobacteria bacterium]|nr:hypothetical protein [Gammaproteobacteria bacterium]